MHTTKLKCLPMREQPAYRVTNDSTSCNITERLATLIGGARQIEIAEALLSYFSGDIRRLYQAHPSELANVYGITPIATVRLKAALRLGVRLNSLNEERTAQPIHQPMPRRIRLFCGSSQICQQGF